MGSAGEEGRSTHERGSHRRDSENEDKEGGRHCPSYTDGRNDENQDREGCGDMQQRGGGGHYRSSLVDNRNNEKQDRGGLGRNMNDDLHDVDPSRRQRDLHETPARKDTLHEARAYEDRQPSQNEDGEPRHNVDDASGAHRQVALGAHSQRNVKDSSKDHRVKRCDVDTVVDDRSWRRQDADDSSGHHHQRSRDDVSKDYKQRISCGADDISDIQDVHDVSGDGRQRRRDASDHHGRRERDVYNSLGDGGRKRGDVDDIRRRRDEDDVVNSRKERRWDVDDTWDNHSRHIAVGDKSNKSRGVDDLGDGRRRRDVDDVPGDSTRRRHNVDGVPDSHSQRKRDMDDSFDNRRRHASGVRDQRSRSPHKRRSHYEKRDTEDDGGRDRFSARFRNAERNEDELPELFSVHRAKVQSVRPFGVFVRLEGFYKQGLVHLSQLSDHEVTDREDSDEMKVQAIAAVAGEGDQVWVKVISLKDDGKGVKIGCSLKLVSQSTGKDLDPNNLKLEQQQPKGNRQELKKVTLDAIYNVVCSRCGGHGHLKTECYGMADKSYELLPEEDDNLTEQLLQPSQTQMPVGEVSLKPGYGRGRAMVLPAWMTHGSGTNAPPNLGISELEKKKKKREASDLPDKITTVEEAMALIAQVKKAKKDKHHRKEHKKHKQERKSKKASNKESSSRKDRGRE